MGNLATRTFTQAFDVVRSELNDISGDVYTDAMLLAKAANVYLEVQDEFRKHSIEFCETVVTSLSYTANQTAINISALTDLLEPLEVWYRPSSSDEWRILTPVGRIQPDQVVSPVELSYWEWSDGVLKVNRASQAYSILLRYAKQLAYPAAASSTVGLDEIFAPLVAGVIGQAALATGKVTAAREWGTSVDARKGDGTLANFGKRTWDAITIAVKRQQAIPRSRAPYRGPRRRGYGVV